MRYSRLLLIAAALCVSLVTAAQARVSRPFFHPARGLGFLTPAATSGGVPVLYVSDEATDAVWLFDADNLKASPIGKLTDGMDYPTALGIDGKDNLYVLNTGKIHIFPPGSTKYNRTIAPRNGTLYGLAVAPDGTLATLSVRDGLKKATLWIFDQGSLKPTRAIGFPLGNNIEFLRASAAIDSSDDVYLSLSRYPNGPDQMIEVAAGSRQPVVTALPTAFGMAFDGQNNLYLGNSNGSTGEIAVYAPGAQQPAYSITNDINVPGYFCALTDGTLFVPNGVHSGEGDVLEFAPGAKRPSAILRNNDVTRPEGTAYRAAGS